MQEVSEPEAGNTSRTGEAVTLDCGVAGCCPQVFKLANGGVEIVDDNAVKISLTAGQFAQLQQLKFT